jgi:hypothetical protein
MQMSSLTTGFVSVFLYEVNVLVDKGYTETLDEVNKQMQNKNIVDFLIGKYGSEIDFSLFTGQRKQEIDELFHDFSIAHEGNERRKWGIENNGLCLLVSWTAEIIRDWEHYVK